MKYLLFLFACSVFVVSHSQNIDNLSKKELKELILKEQQKSDSLSLIIVDLNRDKEIRDSVIKKINLLVFDLEQQIKKIEFESSSCKVAHDSLKTNLITKEKEVNKLSDSLHKALANQKNNFPQIVCSYTEEKIPDCDLPLTVKSCILGSYKNIKTGQPDFEGMYSFSYDLLKKVNNKFIPIKNAELFNSQKMELLEKINKQVKLDFEEFLNGPKKDDCFKGASAPFLTFDDLSIHFGINEIDFIITYSISFNCFSIETTTITYPISEIYPYLNL